MAPGPWYQDEDMAEQCLTPEACGEIRPEESARMYDANGLLLSHPI